MPDSLETALDDVARLEDELTDALETVDRLSRENEALERRLDDLRGMVYDLWRETQQ